MDSFAGIIEVCGDALKILVTSSAPREKDIARDVPIEAVPILTHRLKYSTSCVVL
jgi:hypothetical protein